MNTLKLLYLALRALLVCALYLVCALAFSSWLLSQCHNPFDFLFALPFLPFALYFPWAIAPLHCLAALFDALNHHLAPPSH